jgi:hypothetical protein
VQKQCPQNSPQNGDDCTDYDCERRKTPSRPPTIVESDEKETKRNAER